MGVHANTFLKCIAGQCGMVFYIENLEMNFVGTGVMKRSNENAVIVGILSFYDPPN